LDILAKLDNYVANITAHHADKMLASEAATEIRELRRENTRLRRTSGEPSFSNGENP